MGLTRRQLVARGALGGLVLTGAGWAFPSSSARLQSESGRMLNLVANPRAKRSLDGWDALVPGRDAPGLRAAGDGGAALVLAPGVAFGGIRIGRGDAISCTPGDILWVQADAKAVAAGNGSALSLTVGFSAGGRDLGDLELQVEESVESDRWYTLRGFSAVPPD